MEEFLCALLVKIKSHCASVCVSLPSPRQAFEVKCNEMITDTLTLAHAQSKMMCNKLFRFFSPYICIWARSVRLLSTQLFATITRPPISSFSFISHHPCFDNKYTHTYKYAFVYNAKHYQLLYHLPMCFFFIPHPHSWRMFVVVSITFLYDMLQSNKIDKV